METTPSSAFDVTRLKNERRALLTDVARRALDYLEGLEQRAVFPAPAALAALAEFDEALPDAGDAVSTLRLLDTVGSPATVASAGGRYFGFVVGGALPVTVAANWLATSWDQNAILAVLSPAVSTIETVAARWLVDVLGLPAGTHCSLTTCTTTADITALLAARRAVLQRVGWDAELRGLAGAPPIRVIVGQEVHATILRALSVLGIGRSQIQIVPVDGQGRMRADALPPIDGPTIVCVQVGNVNTGAFDPVGLICDRVAGQGAWVHVDGAFGLWAAASPSLRHLVEGCDRADSWAVDGHKWLNVPYDSGFALVRDGEVLRRSLAMHADYLIQEHRDAVNGTLEASRRARGLEVWAALRSLGRKGLTALVDESCRLARRFADGLRAAGYPILNDVVLNQVLVSFGDAATTRNVVRHIQQDGTCYCSGTVWQGHTAMRISVSSWATTDDDVDRSLAAMLCAAREHGR